MNITNYSDQQVIQLALSLLEGSVGETTNIHTSKQAKEYIQLALAQEKDECFGCMYLNAQHQLLAFEILFRGSISSAQVHPRVLVRRSIEQNATAVILCHNHPSGCVKPSSADKLITKQIAGILKVIDVSVLDHIIVSKQATHSMADNNQIELEVLL